MSNQEGLKQAKSHIDRAKDVLIVSHERPSGDSIGSSLALFLALQSLGKRVMIACPDQITVGLSNFIGVNKITTEVGKKNFVISLDYVEGSIEKVSYNIEGDKFNLVIEPREGFDTFSQDKVSFSQGGGKADVIIAVDTIHLGGLKNIYEANKELFASSPIINIDRHPNNANYGAVNLIQPKAASTTELIWSLIQTLGVAVNQDIATNLLNGLIDGTDNFTSKFVTPEAFELAALCMRSGAVKFSKSSKPEKTKPQHQEHAVQSQPTPQIHKPAVSNDTQKADVPTEPQQQVKTDQTQDQQSQPVTSQSAPADWLKPKIFKSSTRT